MSIRPGDRIRASAPKGLPDKLVDQLRIFPEVAPPEGLSGRIMEALPPRRRPWWAALRFRLARPRIIALTPIRWVPVGTALILGLAIGFSLNRMPTAPFSSTGPQMAQQTDDAQTQYLLGRQLLTEDRPAKALAHLKRAADTRPDHALYQFWLGVAYWTLDDFNRERIHYQTALQHDPDFLPAHVYIGHNYLEQGDYHAARRHYRLVLQVIPDHAEALFNTGVALHRLGETRKENAAWRAYLDYYDRGDLAQQAVARLNANGDFSFRPIQLGPLSLIKPAIRFDDHQIHVDAASTAILDDIGRVVARNDRLELHVLVYAASDAAKARERARAIKRYLLEHDRRIAAQRIKPSWFGISEKIILDDRTVMLPSSIHFFAMTVDTS